MKLAGIIFIILGVLALAYQGIRYTTREKVLEVGPVTVTATERKTIPLRPIAADCGVMIFFARRRSSQVSREDTHASSGRCYMFKRIMVILGAAVFLASVAAQTSAQDVLMNSAETIKVDNFKLALFPTMLFGKNGADSLWGVAGRAGYGFTPSFDVELKGAIFKDLTYFGADAEFWLSGRNANVSVALGGHLTDQGRGGQLRPRHLAPCQHQGMELEFYGGLKLAFDSIRDSDRNVTRAHLVPGIEYGISSELDFLAEVGLALNDDSRSYLSVGFALYIR
jgi:hypothetical protein